MACIAGSSLPLALGGLESERRAAGPEAWRRDLQRLKHCGFDAMDLVDSWLRVDLLSVAEQTQLHQVLAETGIELVGVSVIRASVIDPEGGEAHLSRTLAAVEAAATLGAPVVGVGFHRQLAGPQLRQQFWVAPHPQDDPSPQNFELACRRLRMICDRAAMRSIEVSLELHESTLLDRSERVLRLIDGTNASNLGVNLDIGNLVRLPHELPEPWRETVDRLAPRVNYWHLKNYLRMEHLSGLVMSTPCSIDEGEIDYRYAVDAVLGSGYDGPLCLEHYGGDALAAMQRGALYLTDLLAQRERQPV